MAPHPTAAPPDAVRDSPGGIGKKKFTDAEDEQLRYLVSLYGASQWKNVAWGMNGRTVRQCRERWKYYLEPGIKREEWDEAEDKTLMQKYDEMGPKWAQIAQFFSGRTDIDLKNRFHKLQRSGATSGRNPVSEHDSNDTPENLANLPYPAPKVSIPMMIFPLPVWPIEEDEHKAPTPPPPRYPPPKRIICPVLKGSSS
jgi:hypothetical protein